MNKQISLILTAFILLWLSKGDSIAQEDQLAQARMLNMQALELYKQGKYHEAIPLTQQALTIREKVLGLEHVDVASSMSQLALLHKLTGSYGEAETLYKKSLEITEKLLGSEHLDVATILINFAKLYQSMGANGKAVPLYKRVLTINEKILGPEHPAVVATLNDLAGLYTTMRSFTEAEPLYKQSLKILEKNVGPNHPTFAVGLNNLAALYQSMGLRKKAEPLYKQALAILEKAKVPEYPDVTTILEHLAGLYESMDRYTDAETLYKRKIAILEQAHVAEYPLLVTDIDQLAGMYHSMGRYTDAVLLFKRSLAIREKALGSEHLEVAKNMYYLAWSYREMGSYVDAFPLCKQALDISEKLRGPENVDVADNLNMLSLLYEAIGSYTEAMPLCKRTLEIRKKILGPEHLAVANSLSNLSRLYELTGFYAEAIPLCKQALAIREKAFGPKHSEVAASVHNLGGLYEDIGDYNEAVKFIKRAVAINEKTLGPEHERVALSLGDLASLNYKLGSFAQAESLMKRALAINEKAFGPEHPRVALSLGSLAVIWLATNKIDSAVAIAKRQFNVDLQHYHQLLPYLGENRQITYLTGAHPLSNHWPSFCLKYGKKYPSLCSLVNEMLLNYKGINFEILTAQAKKTKAGDNSVSVLNDSLNLLKGKLATLYLTGPKQGETIDQYQNHAQYLNKLYDEVENKLAVKGYISETKFIPVIALQISRALPEDQVLIDFLYFRNYSFTGNNDGWGYSRYLAFVFQSNQEPKLIDLGEADPIHKSIVDLRSYILTGKLDTTKAAQQQAEAVVKDKGKQLWQQLFKPLLSAIGEKKKVILCVDDWLHYLPFGVMVDEQNRYLLESYQFHYVSTSRDILQWKASSKYASGRARGKANQAVIIADPTFDFTPSPAATASAGSKSFEAEFFARHSRDWRQMGFGQLKYTGPEAVAIDSLLKQKGFATKLYLQDQAQESVLKSVGSPQILHISTHGFFLPDQPELRKHKEIGGFNSIGEFDRTPALENPLLRCGLAFAGANHAESIKEGEDGLATAMEIAGLDLQGTDLVTLSACLTGVGELRSGEGVYGLHRSFLLAGAKTVLASLWSVPDLETKDLMIEFYRRYLSDEKMSKSEALRQAQLAVIEQLRKKYGAAPPAYWGAFVCIGEP